MGRREDPSWSTLPGGGASSPVSHLHVSLSRSEELAFVPPSSLHLGERFQPAALLVADADNGAEYLGHLAGCVGGDGGHMLLSSSSRHIAAGVMGPR